MLVMRDVSKTFNPGTVNEKCALKNLNLTLKQGEFATIVGSNGAGKSTFLKLLCGELEPTHGSVTIPDTVRMSVLKQDHFAYDSILV